MDDIETEQQEMWALADDQRTVCLTMPEVTVHKPGPISIRIHLDASAIDAILTRLTRLRVQMLPPPQRN
jgi:hypothetical protein